MKKIVTPKTIWGLNVFILFLYAVDLFGFRNRYAIIWLILAGLYCLFMKTAVIPDIKTIFLSVGMLCHAIIFKCYYPNWSTTLAMSLGVIPILFYLLGRQLIGRISEYDSYESKAEFVSMIIVIGTFIHALLNFYTWTLGHEGKVWHDFWPDSLCWVTTQHSFLAVPIVSLIAYGIYYLTKKWYYSIFILISAVIANLINILYDNRLVLVLTVVVLGMNVILCIYLNRTSKKVLIFCIGSVAILLIITALIIGLNIGGIRNSTYFHNLISRDGGILRNIRFAGHVKAASQLLSHWKGGGTMDLLGLQHAHNYWLEMANQTGLMSFIPVTLFTISTFIDTIKLITNKTISHKLKYLLPSILMGIFLYHCVEIGGVDRPDYFLYFTLVAGIICQVRKCAESSQDFHN